MNDYPETIIGAAMTAYDVAVCSVVATVLAPYYAFHLLGWGVSNCKGILDSWRVSYE